MTLSSDPRTRSVQRVVSQPSCAQCGSPNTEPVTTRRLCTCDAGEWFRCEECEHIFTPSRLDDP
jgi:hypothetical protein